MSTSVISADAARNLNRKVQEKIDPRLFLCCNYTPTVSYAMSEDAKFAAAIQDLYKFAIDSSCIIKSYKKLVPWSDIPQTLQGDCKQLDTDLNLIRILRSVIDHNNNALNGYLAKKKADRYGEWLQQSLGKPAPEDQADFTRLCQALSDVASRMLKTLDRFIDCVAEHRDKDRIVNQWIDQTLYWYCHNTTQEIYRGQIMDAYIARAKKNEKDYLDLYKVGKLYPKIQRWIIDAFCVSVDAEWKEVDADIKTNQAILNCTAPVAREMRKKMSNEDWSKMESFCRDRIVASEKRKEELSRERQELEEKIGEHSLEFFFEGLEKRLRDTMASCESKGIQYTLLPQDLLQMNVESFFGETPSYWGDF